MRDYSYADKMYLLYLVKVDGFIILSPVEYWAFCRVSLGGSRGGREDGSEGSREEMRKDMQEKGSGVYAAMGDGVMCHSYRGTRWARGSQEPLGSNSSKVTNWARGALFSFST